MDNVEQGSDLEKSSVDDVTALGSTTLQELLAAAAQSPASTEPTPPEGSFNFLGHQRTPSIEELQPFIPNLKLEKVIGTGGMGVVYKAYQSSLKRPVAIKLLHVKRASKSSSLFERFRREAQTLAKLQHSSIVVVFDYGEIEQNPYFVMEYVDGTNLAERMRSGRPTFTEVMSWTEQACSALEYAHDEGIVHRDIKPQNLLIDPKGRLKIADFGIAKLLQQSPDSLTESQLTHANHVMGTPRYMAPEQVQTPQEVDHRADLYALGAVIYQLLTGHLPMGCLEPVSKFNPEINPEIDQVILTLLMPDPEDRYQSAQAFMTALREAMVDSAKTVPLAKPAQTRFSDSNEETVTIVDSPTLTAEGKTIFIAQVSADLDFQVSYMRHQLEQRGYRIVPNTPTFPLDATQAEPLIRRALSEADLSVHLVGSQYGWVPDGSRISIVELQFNLAVEEGQARPEFEQEIWLTPSIDTSDERHLSFLSKVRHQVDANPQKAILNGGPFESFAKKLQDHLEAEKATMQSGSDSHLTTASRPSSVYLISDPVDSPISDRVEDYLFDLGFEVTRSSATNIETDAGLAQRRHLISCDAVLVIFGDVSRAWIDLQLLELSRVTSYGRSAAIPVQAVLVAQPFDREKDRFRTHVAEVIRMDSNYVEFALESFALKAAKR